MKDRRVPGFAFSSLLFLFFYMLLRTIWSDLHSMYYDMIDAAIAEDEPILLTVVLAVMDVIMIVLSFWSVIKVLKGDNDGITSLRWALSMNVCVSLFQILKNLGVALMVHWVLVLLPVCQLGLTLIFLYYLYKSDSVKKLFPLQERRFSPGGWIWMIFFCFCIIFGGYLLYQENLNISRSREYSTELLEIPSGSYCDGTVLFKSDSVWTKSVKSIIDLGLGENEVSLWQLEPGYSSCSVASGIAAKARHADFMSVLLQSKPLDDSLFVDEILSCDTMILGDKYYIDQYGYKADSVNCLWTFSVRFDSRSKKYCSYSNVSEDSDPRQEFTGAISFLKHIIFDLDPYLKKQ